MCVCVLLAQVKKRVADILHTYVDSEKHTHILLFDRKVTGGHVYSGEDEDEGGGVLKTTAEKASDYVYTKTSWSL